MLNNLPTAKKESHDPIAVEAKSTTHGAGRAVQPMALYHMALYHMALYHMALYYMALYHMALYHMPCTHRVV